MRSPNVVLIIADDLGYGDLGCYGSSLNLTPRLDRMASEGVRFTNFYSASSVCSPSRAALMTGCHPQRFGLDYGEDFCVLLPGDAIGLSPDTFSIPRMMKNRGYATKMIGKWHLGDQPEFLPNKHGFDSYFGLPYSNDMVPDYHLDGRFHFPPLPLMRDSDVVEHDPNQASLTDRYTAEAVRFIEDCASQKKPFFLYFAHMYVHVPIHTPMRYQVGSKNGVYGAAVEHLDDGVGRLLDALKANGVSDNTLLIFTSDNGSNGRDGGSNSPLRGTKGTTWEGGMREPCIMNWPGGIPPGEACHELATMMDLLPTLAEVTGGSIPAEHVLDGSDISAMVCGQVLSGHSDRHLLYYGRDRRLHAVRKGRWKLHLIRRELYDLESDVGESRNVWDEHPDVVAELEGIAESGRQELGDAATGASGRGCRPAARVANPRTLTSVAEMDPFIRSLYDLDDLNIP